MLKNHFCPVLSFGGVGSKVHTFEVTCFWINALRADNVVAELASMLEFEFHKIRREQKIRIVCPTIAIQLTPLL